MRLTPTILKSLLSEPPRAEAHQSAAQAAVAVLLVPSENDLSALLIRRAQRVEDPWSGHVALPGGRRDDSDSDLLFTARREVLEEVGVDLAEGATFIGTLQAIRAIAGGRLLDLSISPFVFWLERYPRLFKNEEVEEAFWVRLSELMSGKLDSSHLYEGPHGKLALPAFNVGGRIVWGLTHRILAGLIDKLEARSA